MWLLCLLLGSAITLVIIVMAIELTPSDKRGARLNKFNEAFNRWIANGAIRTDHEFYNVVFFAGEVFQYGDIRSSKSGVTAILGTPDSEGIDPVGETTLKYKFNASAPDGVQVGLVVIVMRNNNIVSWSYQDDRAVPNSSSTVGSPKSP